MKHIKLILLMVLVLTLTGCDDDFFDGGGNGGKSAGGDYNAYWNTIETIAVDGYLEMTQKPELPAPRGDQEDCPMVALLLMLLGGLYSWGRCKKVLYECST